MAAGKGKGGGKTKPKNRNRLAQRATREVQLMQQPQLDYNNAQLQQAQENFLRASQAAQSASGGAYDMIGQAERPQFGQIADEFTSNLNALAPEFGGAGAAVPYTANSIYGERGGTIGMPENEVAAANALGGAIGSAGLSALANDQARFGMSREMAQREASVFGRNEQAALRQQMLDTLQQHENEQQNLMAQQPWQIKSRLDELKDQAIEQQLARSKMRSDEAFSQALIDQIGGTVDNFGRRGGGGGGGGGGGVPTNSSGRPDWGSTHGFNGPYTGPQSGGPGGGGAPPASQFGDRAQRGLEPVAGAWSGGPGARRVVQAVRQADDMGDLPGWVRYAYRRTGGTSLHDMDRRRLYEDRLSDILRRRLGAGGDLYR